jgi:hypothetical protein
MNIRLCSWHGRIAEQLGTGELVERTMSTISGGQVQRAELLCGSGERNMDAQRWDRLEMVWIINS